MNGRTAYFFILHQKSQREGQAPLRLRRDEQALLRLTGKETSQLAELVGGRERTAFEALTDGQGRKDGIDALIGRWAKSEAVLRSGEGPRDSRSRADIDFIALQHGIGDMAHHSRWMLEKIAARNPQCKDFSFTATIASIKVSGPALQAGIIIIPSAIGSTFTFTLSYDSVQNGKEEHIEPQPLSQAGLLGLLERLALLALNHIPRHAKAANRPISRPQFPAPVLNYDPATGRTEI